MEESLGSVKLSEIQTMIDRIARGPVKDPDISFELIMNGLFPDIIRNVLNNLKSEYERGYREGYHDAEKLMSKLP